MMFRVFVYIFVPEKYWPCDASDFKDSFGYYKDKVLLSLIILVN